ncbi:hypothetical protein [Helicobacter sp. 23-1045]
MECFGQIYDSPCNDGMFSCEILRFSCEIAESNTKKHTFRRICQRFLRLDLRLVYGLLRCTRFARAPRNDELFARFCVFGVIRRIFGAESNKKKHENRRISHKICRI